MARNIEGTTAGGFTCDSVGCHLVAVYAPCIVIPFEGHPVQVRRPMFGFVDTHICVKHWKDIRIDDQMTKKMKDTFEETAAAAGLRPAFKRAYVMPARLHSPEFLGFQQTMGLVAPDDALVKGSIIAP